MSTVPNPIRLLVVDDHPVSLLGLAEVFGRHPQFRVVGEATTVRGTLEAVRRTRPDVTLLDLRLPDGTALDVLAQVRAESLAARFVILTGVESAEHAHRALQLGASGFLSKTESVPRIVHALREVAAGGHVVSPDIASLLATRASQPELTTRECEVLALLASGYTNAEIGEMLTISAGTVRTHVSRILEKLGASDRTEAAVLAHRRGLL